MSTTRFRCQNCHEYIAKDVFDRWVHVKNNDCWGFKCTHCSWTGTTEATKNSLGGFPCPNCGAAVTWMDHMAQLDEKWG